MKKRVFQHDYFTQHISAWKQWLAPLKNKPVSALEVGSFEGRSACWLLDNILTHPDAVLCCVDTWLGGNGSPVMELEERFRLNVGDDSRVQIFKGLSSEILPFLIGLCERHYDFIYVDGSHVAMDVLMDACCSWQLLRPGGLLLFDDYGWLMDPVPERRPAMAIDAFLACYAGQYELIHKGWQVLLRRNGS